MDFSLHEVYTHLDLPKVIETFITGGLILLGKFFWDWVKETYAARRRARQHDYFYLAKKQLAEDQYTQYIIDKVGSEYAWLYRLHNGEHWEGGDGVKKMSMVSEARRNNALRSWKDESQGVLLSRYPNYIVSLGENPILAQHIEDTMDYDMQTKMMQRGIATSVSLLISGPSNRPLGILVLAWCEPNLLVNRIKIPSLETYRRQAGAILIS